MQPLLPSEARFLVHFENEKWCVEVLFLLGLMTGKTTVIQLALGNGTQMKNSVLIGNILLLLH